MVVHNVQKDFTLPAEAMGKLLDLTPRRLQQLSKEGVIPAAVRGKYEVVATVQGYVKYLRSRALGTELGSEKYTNERAAREGVKREISEMHRDVLRNTLVHVDDVQNVWAAIVSNVKTRLLLIPSKVSARVVALRTPVKVQALLKAEINEALDECSKFTISALPSASGKVGDGNSSGVRATAAADSL